MTRCCFGLDNPLFKRVQEIHIFSWTASRLFFFSLSILTFYFQKNFMWPMPTSILSLGWFVCLCASTITVWKDSRKTGTIRNETIKHLPTQGSNWACSLRRRRCHLFIPWCSQSVLSFFTGPCCAPTPRTNLSCLSHWISFLSPLRQGLYTRAQLLQQEKNPLSLLGKSPSSGHLARSSPCTKYLTVEKLPEDLFRVSDRIF